MTPGRPPRLPRPPARRAAAASRGRFAPSRSARRRSLDGRRPRRARPGRVRWRRRRAHGPSGTTRAPRGRRPPAAVRRPSLGRSFPPRSRSRALAFFSPLSLCPKERAGLARSSATPVAIIDPNPWGRVARKQRRALSEHVAIEERPQVGALSCNVSGREAWGEDRHAAEREVLIPLELEREHRAPRSPTKARRLGNDKRPV